MLKNLVALTNNYVQDEFETPLNIHANYNYEEVCLDFNLCEKCFEFPVILNNFYIRKKLTDKHLQTVSICRKQAVDNAVGSNS